MSQTRWIVGDIGKDLSLFVVVFTEYFVLAQIEPITHTESERKILLKYMSNRKLSNVVPVVALLAGETFQVVDVTFGPHHHLEGRDHFIARSTVARVAK